MKIIEIRVWAALFENIIKAYDIYLESLSA